MNPKNFDFQTLRVLHFLIFLDSFCIVGPAEKGPWWIRINEQASFRYKPTTLGMK